MKLVLHVLATALALALFSSTAAAQGPAAPHSTEPTTDQRALAEMLFFTGKGMMGEGRLAEACTKFAESYRLDPAAGTLLNLAVCHEKDGKIASAWGEFHQALAEARRANRQDRMDLAGEAIKRIEPDLPFLVITVPAGVRVPGLEVKRNGVPLLAGAWETELPIDPGTNEIEASAPAYKVETKTVTLQKRQHVTITLDPLELAPVEKPPPPFWTAKRKVGAALIASGIAAAAVGGVFGALALSEKHTSDADCPTLDGEIRCTSAGSHASSNAVTDAWVANIGIGVGAAAIISGGLLYALGGARQDDAAPAKQGSAWSVRVLSGPRGAEAFLSHAF